MSNAMRSGKRWLAGVAAGALGAGLVVGVTATPASAQAAAISFDLPSYTMVVDNFDTNTPLPVFIGALNVNGNPVAAGDALGPQREVRVTLAAPATAADDTALAIVTGAGATPQNARGQQWVLNSANTGADLDRIWVAPVSTAGVWNAGATTAWNQVDDTVYGTYTLTAQLINTTNGAVLSTATMPIQVLAAAGAPAANINWHNVLNQPAAGFGLNVLNQIGATQSAARGAYVVSMTNASGGPFVAAINDDTGIGDDTVGLVITTGNADDTTAPAAIAPDLTNVTGQYAVAAAGNWSGQRTSSSFTATYSRTGNSNAASGTVPVALGTLPGNMQLTLTTTPQGEAADGTLLVPVGTTSLTFGAAYQTATAGSAQYNVVTDSGAGGTVVSSGGVILTNATGQGSLTINVAGTATQLNDELNVAVTGNNYRVRFVAPGAQVDALGGIAQIATSSPIVGTITNVFGGDLQGTWIMTLRPQGQFCNSPLPALATTTAAADGAFTLQIPAASALTAPGVATFQVCAFNGIQFLANAGTAVNVTYTATGTVNTFVVNTDAPGAGFPVVETPRTGIVNLVNSTQNVVQVADDADPNAVGTQEVFKITPVTSPATAITATASEGALLTRQVAGTRAWTAGVTSITAAQGTQMAVFATKPGRHTITVAAGSVTRTVEFIAGVAADAGRQITMDTPTLSVGTRQSFPVSGKVTDIYGNRVPGAEVDALGFGSVQNPFGGGAILFANANGEVNFLFTAGEIAGDGVARFQFGAGFVADAIPGSPELRRVADTNVTVSTATRSIVITGTRTTVGGKPGIRVEGDSTGIADGAKMKPWVRFPGQSDYTVGTARPTVDAAGDFAWQRKTGKKTYVFFTTEDESAKSNRVIIEANNR